ncbi:Ribosomal protein S18 acetylase RimI [Bacillus sp. OV166]|uniref:GNAT family N-acetyltransferase n=1 Tax=Bacillus sp. OV166 TaxID=1882763 RepID=UPI000A2AE5B9|nr:GNAT family N-acetyltransferase [Bacillus sp. OV166]SMQ79499.1 Ribosomal protein S18 acetylase RimI [Bacillus sp. OV166]
MLDFRIEKITNLASIDLTLLMKESNENGFRFTERLVNDFINGKNTFNQRGEGFYGVFNEEGVIIAIGGINIDPFANDPQIGRIRRFYVLKEYRRKGIGRFLINKILFDARKTFKEVVLHTETEDADQFYTSLGFSKSTSYQNSTHHIKLKLFMQKLYNPE